MLAIWMVSGIAGFAGLRNLKGRAVLPALALVSLFIALYPINGLSFSDYVLSLNPSFSIGTVVYFFCVLWKRFAGAPLISDRDWVWFAIWNVSVGLCLYASSLGFVEIDLYPLGYGVSVLFLIVAFLTGLLILFRNSIAYIFILYIVAYDLELLISRNYFDYMTDALLFFISMGILINFSVLKYKRSANRVVCGNASCTGVED